jgi:hypothetical protein
VLGILHHDAEVRGGEAGEGVGAAGPSGGHGGPP